MGWWQPCLSSEIGLSLPLEPESIPCGMWVRGAAATSAPLHNINDGAELSLQLTF
jgi:hypothetical protein